MCDDKVRCVQSQKYYSLDVMKNSRESGIPLPKSGNYSLNYSGKIESKNIKTEKNRLKLLEDNNFNDDIQDKEIRITCESSGGKYIPRYQLSSSKISRVDLKEESQLRGKIEKQQQQQLGTLRPDKPDLPASTCLPHHHHPHHYHHQQENLKNENSSRVSTIPSSYETFERDHTSTVTSCQVTSLQTSLSRDRCKVKGINQNVMEEPTTTTSKSEITKNENIKRYQEDDCSSEDDLKLSDKEKTLKCNGTWPIKRDTWMENSPLYTSATSTNPGLSIGQNVDMSSVMSFSSSSACSGSVVQGHRRLGAKVDVVYSLLGMLGSNEGREDMSGTLLAMSNSKESCLIMRQSGCLPLLIQLIHAPGQDPETRERASQALHNVIHARSDEKVGRREVRVLRLLEQVRDYCQVLRISLENERPLDDLERHPGPTIAALMKLSFDEAHRHAMCQLGGLHAVAELIEMDHAAHGSDSNDSTCITLRRYAGMALTNLTFGDGNNKALLCSFREFMKALVLQLRSMSDDLRQVTASVLRNLSWRADSGSKKTLREVGAVTGLMRASMEGSKESTLKSILSALWNLSAHCSENKVDICAVNGALAFLVDMLSYNAPSKTLAIIENTGGILRNVSSHIAVREDYRAIVRERGCLQVLLSQLRSPSLTVVSNACGALWNLSARDPHDQKLLWDLGAVPMLRSLVHSKHKMISMGSSAALKNLLSARPGGGNLVHLDSTARGLGLPALPTLGARRQKALEQEIDQNLSETCENIEPSTSPINKDDKFLFKESNFSDITGINSRVKTYQRGKFSGVSRSESRESMKSITSTHSDTIFERVHRHVSGGLNPMDIQMKQQSSSLHSAVDFNLGTTELQSKTNQLEKNYALKYKNSIAERTTRPTELGINILDIGELRCTSSTMSWATGPNQESACSLLRSSIDDKLSSTSSNINLIDEEQIIDESFTKLSSPVITTTFKSSNNSSQTPTVVTTIINSPTLSHASEVDPFGDYAETDLDQPTNYSLRYAEKNSDEDEKQSSGYFAGSEQDIEDTVKTYYTEGTPYENSLNSSRATSHSDLQDDSKIKVSDKIQLIDKLNTEERGIISRIKELNISGRKSTSKRSSYIDKTENSTLNSSFKRLSLPPNPMEINSDIDSGISQATDEKSTDIVVESMVRLNSLVSDDESKILNDTKSRERELRLSRKQTLEPESLTESMASDGDDDDEDLLAACIHIGMQNNRHRQSFRRNSLEKGSRGDGHLTRYETSSELNQVEPNNGPKSLNIKLNSEIHEDENTPHYPNESEIKIKSENVLKRFLSKGDDDSSMNSIEENDMQTTLECTESMESYDSVERSEQVLLELCIKSSTENNKSIMKPNQKSSSGEDVCDSKHHTLSEHQEETSNVEEYRRQRDPDAMIACMDRLTATLVQETEAMREREYSTMKQSIQSDKNDTWNEDSPNDNSFPTITTSVPLVASFKSDENHTLSEESRSMPKSLVNDGMTTSKIIEQEAFKLAEAVNAECSEMSLPFQDLDSIKPPSTMGSLGSLVTSYTGPESHDNLSIGDRCYSTSLPPALFRAQQSARKKSLPIGIVAKRALGQTSINQIQTGSLESLINDSNVSQLENVKPPSMMEDLLTLDSAGDLENSMISVSSITSEIADGKINCLTSSDHTFDLVKPIANKLSLTCAKYAEGNSAGNSLSEYLENINPPSLLNEVSEIDDTTVDANTDTMCSDTLCMDVELLTEEFGLTHTIYQDKIDEADNDTDGATTPIPTEYSLSSSAESTPKKRLNKNHLTPKQKRQLAKERYKTYTIAAELVKKEEEERRKMNGEVESRGKLSPFSKLTTKQRRQEDRARFQTQVLDNPLGFAGGLGQEEETEMENKGKNITDQSQGFNKSGIPSFKGLGGSGTFRKKTRVENKDRYKTRILNDFGTSNDATTSSEEIQTMLEKNANIVLNQLNETNKTVVENFDETSEEKSSLSNDTSRFSTYVRKSRQENELIENKKSNDVDDKIAVKNDQVFTMEDEIISDDDENESSEEIEVDEQPKRPRITKPSREQSIDSNNTDKSEPASPKGIRGRRKALYSNPNTRKTTPQSSPIKLTNIPIGRSNTTPLVRATRATKLRQNNNNNNNINNNNNVNLASNINIPQKINYIARNVELSKRSSIPQRGGTSGNLTGIKSFKRHSTPPECPTTTTVHDKKKIEVPKPLERQGTFTKDEPEMDNPPIVSANSSPIKTSKIAKPTRGSPSKLNSIFKSKIIPKNHQAKLSKCASAEGIPSKGFTLAEASSKQDGNKKNPVLGNRSSSNLSSTSSSSPSGGTKKSTKDATSKIASLWKKVEDCKNKQKYEKPDTRQWITKNSDKIQDDDDDEVLSVETSNYRLFRSSTFEGVPKQSNKVKTKAKIVEKFCEVSGDEELSMKNSSDYSSGSGNESKIPKFGGGKKMQVGNDTVVLRKQKSVDSTDGDLTKRISRLGSFIRVDAEHPEGIRVFTNSQNDFNSETDVVTASAKVTTV